MRENFPSSPNIFIIVIISWLSQVAYSANCSRERCCLSSPCTSLYCQQQNSQTWISTQNYASYQYTKLVVASNQCKPCAYNCKQCSSETSCTTCYDGYYMDNTNTNPKCRPCNYKCLNCQVVNTISKCSLCDAGSYLNPDTLSCALCPLGAQTCLDATTIQSCLPGYQKSSNSMFCSPCPSFCLSCPSSVSVCSTCQTGYYTSTTGICKVCNISNCNSCTAVGSNVYCSTCNAGYFKYNNTVCSACVSNCLSCTNATICISCAANYYLQSGGCVLVPAANRLLNCIYYSFNTSNNNNNGYQCNTCQSSYYLSPSSSSSVSQCLTCSILCTQCYGNHFGRCTSCTSNAILFNQMCIAIPYINSNTIQLYYTATNNNNQFIGGMLTCSNYLYSSTSSIVIALNSLSVYKVNIVYKLYAGVSGQLYSIMWNSVTNSVISTNGSVGFNFSVGSFGYQICTDNNNTYYTHSNNITVTNIGINNTLTFSLPPSSSSSSFLHISQILIQGYQCSSLCLQCSQWQCVRCVSQNLYKQDAYCVYMCDVGYYTYQINKQCLKQCPMQTYPLLTNVSCVACVAPCMTCINDKYCLSCTSGYYLDTNSNTCLQSCPYQYYASLSTQMCQKCVGRCNQCVDDTICSTCKIGFLQNSTCVDSCSQGYYQNLSTLQCLPCSNICLTCSYSANYCTTCTNTTVYFNNTCINKCPIAYIPNTINITATVQTNGSIITITNMNICIACQYPCQLCNNTVSSCLSCIDGYLYNNICVSQCAIGYYQDNILLQCVKCDSFCVKCTASATDCQLCVSGYKLYNATCLPFCPSGYFATVFNNISICTKCTNLCQTCVNSSFCLSCSANFLASNNSGQCMRASACQFGYYADISTLKCLPCNNNASTNCATCQYYNNYCTSCSNGYILWNSSCVTTCPTTYYYNATTLLTINTINVNVSQCVRCVPPCLTCLSQSACLSCMLGYKYNSLQHICSSTCSVSLFFNSTISDCQPCSPNCLMCSSATFCYSCNTSTYLHMLTSTTNQCLTQCPTYYFADLSQCMPCIYSCLECTTSIDCLTCSNGVLYQSRCLPSCPDSTYLTVNNVTNTNITSVNYICRDCSGSCLTCKNSSTQCTMCKPPLYLVQSEYRCVGSCPNGSYPFELSKSCLACPSVCQTCINTTYCLSCLANKTYLNTEAHMCMQFCNTGYFANANSLTCQKCSNNCQTCVNTASQCMSCANGWLLLRGTTISYQCVLACPALYYNDSNTCYPCIFPCQQCTSSSKCLTCSTGTFFHSPTQSCLMFCPIGTYYNTTNSLSQQCSACLSPCATCTLNQTNCISCIPNYLLYNGKCVQQCPTKYYPQPSGICNRCYGLCQTCNSKYQCITCLAGFAYSGYCYSACPLGTYADNINKLCLPCHSPCIQCTSTATYCKRCEMNLFAYKGQCSSTCPNGTYVSGDVCQSCLFPCVRCTNQFTCQQCIGGYLLYMNTSCIADVEVCPNDLYKMDSIACVPSTWCPPNYYRDEDIKTCARQCSKQKYIDNENRLCLYQCYSWQYVSESMVCMNWTEENAKSLMLMSAITYIKSSQIYIDIIFNQTQKWLQQTQNMYEIVSQDLGTNTRLLSTTNTNTNNIKFTMNQYTQLILQIIQMPYYAKITLPAFYVSSSVTNYNLQNPNITVKLPIFTPYTYEQVYTASIIAQFSQGISWFIILFSMFFLFLNRLSDVYILWDTAQLLYLLIFLNLQYPPNLNQFFRGLANIHFLFLPSIFNNILPQQRLVSSPPFYAYSYDNSFIRTAGSPILIIAIVFAIFLLLKLIQTMIKKIDKVKQKFDQYPTIKNYIFKGILRYRWHHTSDVFFLSYDIIVLFAVAQIYNMASNPANLASNIICIIVLLIYLIFPLFVSYKLYKHYKNIAKGKMVQNLQCFYRGIQKTNKFGIALILIRYFRKLSYCLIIGLFTSQPMFAIPILMFTSVLMGIFIFINRPFKKRLSNIITVLTQTILVLVYIFIALVQFGQQYLSSSVKVIFGWICCGLLLVMLLGLVFQIFCKTMFYLQAQPDINSATKIRSENDLTKKFSQEYLRQKAGEFFDKIFPKLKQHFDFNSSQQDMNEHQYQQGDSQNSQNNQNREKDWGLESQNQDKHTDQFKHYGGDSEDGSQGKINQKNKPPNYLIRCVKEIQ